jgi:hypothetical protein
MTNRERITMARAALRMIGGPNERAAVVVLMDDVDALDSDGGGRDNPIFKKEGPSSPTRSEAFLSHPTLARGLAIIKESAT